MVVFTPATAHDDAVHGFTCPGAFLRFHCQGMIGESQGPEEVGVAAVGPVRVVTDQSRLGVAFFNSGNICLLYTSPSPRD